jgi:hypothetical protein
MPYDAPPFPISYLTLMIFNLSSMLDSGKHDDISLEEVKQHIDVGDLITFLNKRAEQEADTFDNGFSVVEPTFINWYVARLKDNCEVMDGRERRKYGVESRGLCLLISYTAEIIQGGTGIRPRDI